MINCICMSSNKQLKKFSCATAASHHKLIITDAWKLSKILTVYFSPVSYKIPSMTYSILKKHGNFYILDTMSYQFSSRNPTWLTADPNKCMLLNFVAADKSSHLWHLASPPTYLTLVWPEPISMQNRAHSGSNSW